MGAFLLWTVAFVLADENNTEATTGDTAEVTTTTEATTGDTAEVTTTTEITTGDTAEVTADTTGAETEEVAENTEDNTSTISDAAKEKYSEEQIAAYTWAFENGITTINDIEKAKLSDWLTRAQLAKMMSQYMTNVLWKTPAEVEKVEYADVDSSLGDLADFIQVAYAYKIMWINADGTPIKKFNPKGQVTRAEYATVFSRVLFGDRFNKSEWNYYENHLAALKKVGILTNDTPSIKEVRGWVMLMMYRSSSANLEAVNEEPSEETTEETAEPVVGMANPASVYCEEQGWTITIVKDEEGNESGICKLADGTEVEEWEYYRANHKDETETTSGDVAPLYTEEDLKAAEKVITDDGFGKMTVKVENVKITYMWDEKASSELKYCQELDATVEECAVFESEFYIPEQDAQMAWAFEPDTTLRDYSWYLGKNAAWEWEILSNGFG